MMKVLFVCSGNHRAITPVVQNQANAVKNSGVDVDIYQIKGHGILGYLRNLKPLKRYILTNQYDVVHAHFSLTAFLVTLVGVHPLVISLMGSDVRDAKWYTYLIRLFAWVGRWDAVIVKSKDMYDFLGLQKAIVLPNGVDFDRFHPMDKLECQNQLGWRVDKKHILFPANPKRPDKDYSLANCAFALMNMTNIEVHFFVNVPNEQTPIWYNAADLVLLTSRVEGSPNAIKEAMACNRPIVVTKVGDVFERLNKVTNCYVATTRNPEEIVQLIQTALKMDVDSNGREKLKKDGLSNDIIVSKLVSLYEKLK